MDCEPACMLRRCVWIANLPVCLVEVYGLRTCLYVEEMCMDCEPACIKKNNLEVK